MTNPEDVILTKSYIQLIIDGFKLFLKSYGHLILVFIIFIIISNLLITFAMADLRWFLSTELFIGYLIYNLIESIVFLIFFFLATCSSSIYIFKKYNNRNPNFVNDFKQALNLRLIAVLLIFAVLIPLIQYFFIFFPFNPITAILYLLNPSQTIYDISLYIFYAVLEITISSYFIFMIFTYSIKENISMYRKARSLSRGSNLQIFSIILFYFILMELMGFVFTSGFHNLFDISQISIFVIYDPNNRDYGLILFYQFFTSIPSIIFGPLLICLLTPLFTSQLIKKSKPSDLLISSKQEVEKIITELKFVGNCLYCGKFIKSTYDDLCPYCGNTL